MGALDRGQHTQEVVVARAPADAPVGQDAEQGGQGQLGLPLPRAADGVEDARHPQGVLHGG